MLEDESWNARPQGQGPTTMDGPHRQSTGSRGPTARGTRMRVGPAAHAPRDTRAGQGVCWPRCLGNTRSPARGRASASPAERSPRPRRPPQSSGPAVPPQPPVDTLDRHGSPPSRDRASRVSRCRAPDRAAHHRPTPCPWLFSAAGGPKSAPLIPATDMRFAAVHASHQAAEAADDV